jgi:excisionase family DNA binding protein
VREASNAGRQLDGVEGLVGVRDVAELIGRSVSWVYHAVESGVLPHYKLGASRFAPIRFRLSEVEEWLQAQRAPANGSTSS